MFAGEIDEMVEAFDDALSQLRREKFRLEADLKLASIKSLVMVQELGLLRDFEKREDTLFAKRQAKLDDKVEVLDKIADCQVWQLLTLVEHGTNETKPMLN
jgi:cilia- and flagella-associated protein 44